MSDLGFGKVIWATEGRWDQSRGQVETGRPLGGADHPEHLRSGPMPHRSPLLTAHQPFHCTGVNLGLRVTQSCPRAHGVRTGPRLDSGIFWLNTVL